MGAVRDLLVLALFISGCLAVGLIGSLFTAPAIPGWYAGLNKPPWNPPNSLFGPVWTALYISMGVAAWLVWRGRGFPEAAIPLAIFAFQLLLNLLWSVIFFGMHLIGLALAEIVLLWFAILATIVAFWRVQPVAGAILVPYLLWVSYATALNFSLWRRN